MHSSVGERYALGLRPNIKVIRNLFSKNKQFIRLKKRKKIDICRISSIEYLSLQINERKSFISMYSTFVSLYSLLRLNVYIYIYIYTYIRISFCGIERKEGEERGKNVYTVELINVSTIREPFLIQQEGLMTCDSPILLQSKHAINCTRNRTSFFLYDQSYDQLFQLRIVSFSKLLITGKIYVFQFY